ncbi:endonuclease lcl3 [Penicillium macrosclerotiorum]|uniref:endonuclease lcl3 n=1 Tax=Penicillium macrosclerotiorum TaxID=303699 RepID=UPI002546FDD8|nr:endonuclease lcl3 [Penicillium macrosclerotiorum]KAJ5688616.1 endonuclease lcl3 [Penicillium macrosclerotiorum]
MRWPPWRSESSNDDKQPPECKPSPDSSRPTSATNNPSFPLDWAAFTESRTLISTVVLTSGILLAVRLHRQYLRRFPDATSISPSFLRRRTVFGQVTSVGDGDNFRIYHTPGGRLVGWGWLPWKKVPTTKKELKDKTVCILPRRMALCFRPDFGVYLTVPSVIQIHIRLAGIDAPELAHFGRPEQPFAREAHEWLISYLQNRRVRASVYRQDQYQRVVASVYVRRAFDFPPFRRRDVSFEMLKRGLATVYEAKMGAEFGGKVMEQKYRRAEWWAKARSKGLWKDYRRVGSNWESPREYKTRMGMGDLADNGGKSK